MKGLIAKRLVLILLIGSMTVLSVFGAGQGARAVVDEAEFPSRPITILVGFAPGGGMDVMSRVLAPEMSEYLGVEVTVVNMPGAASGMAADYLNNQPADGYFLFAASSGVCTFPAMGYSDVTYEQMGMLAIPIIAEPAFQVPYNSPFRDMGDLIEAWKRGGTIAANNGPGAIWHIPQVLAVNAVGGEVTYAPFEGGAGAALAVAQGQVDWGTSGAFMESSQYFREGMSRPLAIFSDQPYNIPGYGVIPPITDWIPELRGQILAGSGWRGLAYKRGIPEDRLRILSEAVRHAVESARFRNFMTDAGMIDGNLYGAEADAVLESTTRVQSWMLVDIGEALRSPEEVGVPRP